MDLLGGSRRILAAHQPLVVPMNLRLSNFKLNAYVVLVVSKTKGITLVFKTDPLQNVDVSSTFDSIAVIQKYIQKEIEGQLREMFREDLPAIIHKLSQRWIPGNSKIETPYARKNQHLSTKESQRLETMSSPGHGYHPAHIPVYRFPTVGIRPGLVPRPSSVSAASFGRGRSLTSSPLTSSPVFPPRQGLPATRTPSFTTPSTPASDDNESTFPELENYDPTYGMRPEGLPTKSAYASFGRLWQSPRGLADLTEQPDEARLEDEIDCTEQSFDQLGWNDSQYEGSAIDSAAYTDAPPEYEALPAIGGGTITRPRVFHAQSFGPGKSLSPLSTPSMIFGSSQSPTPSRANSLFPTLSQSPLSRQWAGDIDGDQMELGASAQTYNPYRANSSTPGPSRPRLARVLQSGRFLHPEQAEHYKPTDISHEFNSATTTSHQHSPESSFRSYSSSGAVTHSLSTPPTSELQHLEPEIDDTAFLGGHPDPFQRRRTGSISLSAVHPFDDDMLLDPTASISHELEASPSAIHPLRPGQNSAAHLSTLSYSNHTLSPFTRSLEHFTVRSGLHVRRRLAAGDGQASPASMTEPRVPVKARRKRTFYLGGKKKAPEPPLPEPSDSSPPSSPPMSPGAPSEYSEVDHYFAATAGSSLRRRTSFQF